MSERGRVMTANQSSSDQSVYDFELADRAYGLFTLVEKRRAVEEPQPHLPRHRGRLRSPMAARDCETGSRVTGREAVGRRERTR